MLIYSWVVVVSMVTMYIIPQDGGWYWQEMNKDMLQRHYWSQLMIAPLQTMTHSMTKVRLSVHLWVLSVCLYICMYVSVSICTWSHTSMMFSLIPTYHTAMLDYISFPNSMILAIRNYYSCIPQWYIEEAVVSFMCRWRRRSHTLLFSLFSGCQKMLTRSLQYCHIMLTWVLQQASVSLTSC